MIGAFDQNGEDRFMGSVVPLMPLRRVDDLIERLSEIRDDADKRGFRSLAYFVETALIEARIQQQQLEQVRADRPPVPTSSGGPLSDS